MKASKAEVMKRVEKIFSMRVRGADFAEVRRYASLVQPENGLPWNLSDRQLQRYIARADELFSRSLERDRAAREPADVTVEGRAHFLSSRALTVKLLTRKEKAYGIHNRRGIETTEGAAMDHQAAIYARSAARAETDRLLPDHFAQPVGPNSESSGRERRCGEVND